jgi:hypothetical protein
MVGRGILEFGAVGDGGTAWSTEFSLRGLNSLSFCGLSPVAFLIRTSSTSFRPNGDRGLLPEGLSCRAWVPSPDTGVPPVTGALPTTGALSHGRTAVAGTDPKL